MAQFDLYTGIGRTNAYVVDLQADLLDQLATRIVAPLMPRAETEIITGLTPLVEVNGTEFVVLTQELAAVPARELRNRVASLAPHQ